MFPMVEQSTTLCYFRKIENMRKLLLCYIFFILVSCTDRPYYYYGELIEDKVHNSYSLLLNNIGNNILENVSLKGEIIQTCAKKGCWLKMKVLEEDTLMVRFRDYGFFIPKQGMEGKIAIVKGSAFMDTIAVEMLRHYAEDAGESKEKILLITEPKYVLNFIADGVLIKK